MKKTILAIGLVGAMAATAVVGGTLAYFTDTDQKTNTFTAGGVKIDLIEQQVNDGGTALEDFKQNQVLMPIVGSAQGDKDSFGQPVAENYIDKIVTIKNTGNSDAYVRAYFAIPTALDDGYETFNAGLNVLHFNFGNANGATTQGISGTGITIVALGSITRPPLMVLNTTSTTLTIIRRWLLVLPLSSSYLVSTWIKMLT